MMNVINGGAHAQNSIDLQEFMVVPAGASTFAEALRIGAEVYHALQRRAARAGPLDRRSATRAASRPTCRRARRRSRRSSRRPSAPGVRDRVAIALDPATTESPRRRLPLRGPRARTADGLSDFWAGLAASYPIVSIEDGAAEDDWEAWKRAHRRSSATGSSSSATTSSSRTPSGCSAASTSGVANSILVKVNQIGTLTETLEAIAPRPRAGYTAVMSHRSGETEDTTIADLAVATDAGQIKTGAPARRDASRSTTSCSGSRRSSATPRCTPAGPRFPGRQR